MVRVVLLPPIPLNAFPYQEFTILVKKISIEKFINDVKEILAKGYKLECYVRHESTVRLLSQLLNIELKPSAELYQYREGDEIYIIGLKRPVRGQELQVNVNDLEIAYIIVFPKLII